MTGARGRKHALAGEGPIVNRARRALRLVAEQFGTVTAADRTTVSVRAPDGLPLTLSYDPGNYVFSRVYNLTITAPLPADTAVPAGIALSHRGREGARFVSRQATENGATAGGTALDALNAAVRDRLGGIDLLQARVEGGRGSRTLTLTPMGGSYVWVLIPPVFKATAFPPGEPRRILELVGALRDWTPTPATR